MKLIAHRGLINGPDQKLENLPSQIILALHKGYDCEIDLRVIDGKFYLGHDNPDYQVEEEFIQRPGLWIHAKNLTALHYLSTTDLAYFWHQNDDCVITSNGYIWTYPEKELTDRSIRLMPEWKDPELKTVLGHQCYAVCSDYIEAIKEIIASAQS
jgi:hypothetical protein